VLLKYYNAHRENYQQAGLDSSGTDTGNAGVTGPQTQSGIAPFAEVKEQLTQDYETDSYNSMITQRADSASVHVNAGVLAAIQLS